jgi:hypothetical protein
VDTSQEAPVRKRALTILVLLLVLIAGILIAGFLSGNPVIIGAVVAVIGVPLIVYTLLPYRTPGWVKRVLESGTPTHAIVLANDYLKGMGGYSGGDIWIDLPVQVETPGEESYQARMKCRLTQSWAIAAGSRVPVRFDPSNPGRVVLTGDLQALLRGRPNE